MVQLKNAQCNLFILPFANTLKEVMHPEKRKEESFSDAGLSCVL